MATLDDQAAARAVAPPASEATNVAAAAAAAAEQRVQHCLRVLQGKSDEHKFAGLLMVAKLNDLPLERLQQVRRQVLATVGAKFFLRLLHTRGAETDGLSTFQTLGLNLIASFCSDAEVAAAFADEQLARFLLEQLESSRTAPQAQGDCVSILQGVAATDKGKRLASDAAFWTTLSAPDVTFICSSLARAPGGRVSLAVLAVQRKLLTLVECGSVSFDALVRPHLDVVRQGVLQFLQSKWPHQERDACLQLVQSLMEHAGPSWLLGSESTEAPLAGTASATPTTAVPAGAVSGSKFLLVVVKLVGIEIKLMLDDVELALVQMEDKQVERVDEAERQEREVARALQMLPVCYRIVEMAISTLVASLGDDMDDDDAPPLLPYDVLLDLKHALVQLFGVVFEFLTLAREYMQTHRFRELEARGAASVPQLDAVVYASVRVVSAWIAEDPDACMAELVALAPFLVLYEPLAQPAPPRMATSEMDSDDELDSDDEVVEVDDHGAATGQGAAPWSVDPLHFLLPGLLQLSATPDGAAALAHGDIAVLRRLLRFSCALCAGVSVSDDSSDADDRPSLPTLTLALGMLVNLLLEKDSDSSPSARSAHNVPHASEWRRALAFLLPLACASGAAVVHDAARTLDDRGGDDQYVLLLHVVCVVLLIASETSARGAHQQPSPTLAALVAPFHELVAWLVRHPPSATSDASSDLFELVRMLSLRVRVTEQTLAL